MKGSLRFDSVSSTALAGNPLGDPHTRELLVYLPPGYEASQARFPSVYFLHGFSGSGRAWANASAFSPNVPERLDDLIAQERIPPVIGVFVDGWTALGGSQWIDSEATGRYREYLRNDIVSTVDKSLRTVPLGRARALVGKSSGGYGALAMASQHPEVFAHVAAHSADAYFEYCYLPEFPRAAGPLLKAGGAEPWFREFQARSRETRMKTEDFPVINTLAMAAAYSPRKGEPLGLELPFDLQTGRIKLAVWERWLGNDPVRFAAERMASFKNLASLFVDCGTRDEFHLRWGARMLVQILQREGANVKHEEFEDGHMGINYRYDHSLMYLAPRLSRG